MFKKVYWKLGLVVTLLLTVFLAFSLLAQAANASTNTLTVEYDSGCVAVRLYYKNGDAEISEVLQNGVPKEIPSGISNVRLVLELGDGYDVDVATDGEVEIFRPDDLIFDFGVGLTEDKTITVSTKPKVYDIVYIRTTEEGTANTDGFPTQHTYNTITEIPNPTLTGYNFVKWLILTDHPDNIPNFDPSNSNDELRPGSNAVSVSLPANKIPVDSARDTFYLYPVWTPKTYPVYCYDVIYSGYASDPFGGYLHGAVPYLVGEFPAGATFRGNDAAFVNNSVNHDYRGFWFDEAATLAIDKGTITVMAYETGATKQNTVYRYYTPYEYDIEYGCSTGSSTLTPADGSELPTTHVYNRNTDLPALVLTGYTFAGWKAEVFDGAVWVDVSSSLSPVGEIFRMYAGAVDSPSAFHSECSPDYEGRRVIRLTALWTALEYDVTYDFEGALDVVFPADQYGTYVFDTDLVIPNPVRRGYTFLGWTLTSGSLSGVEIDEENGFTTLPAATYTNGITLVARWQANTYQITFNGNGADSQWSPSPLYATFDQVFAFPSNFTFPTKLGHDFKGFSLDAAGTQMITNAAGSLLTPVWNIDADTVLYAQWEPRSYTVTITDSNGKLFDNTEITVNGQTYSGSGLTFRYGDTVTVVINVLRDGGSYRPFKLIAWQGVGDSAPQAIANAYTYTYTFTLGAGDTELVGVMAPIVTVPEIMVDYVDEKLVSNDGELPDGIYRISYGTISQLIEITNGKIYITDNEGQKTQYQLIRLDDSAFGSTVKIVVCGNGSTTADSDEILLAVNPRPAAPVLSATGEIKDVYAYEDTKIVVQMKVPVDLSKYEFAISDAHRINGNLIWYSGDALPSPGEGAVMFEHLRVGTPYYVYVRLKAVPGEHPHGLTQTGAEYDGIHRETTSDMTIEAKQQELLQIKNSAEGEVLAQLIDSVIAQLNDLRDQGASSEFEHEMNRILEQVSPTQIELAKTKDSLINALTAHYNMLYHSGWFNETNLANLTLMLTQSKLAIRDAASSDAAQRAYNDAIEQMTEIRVSQMTVGDLTVNSLGHTLPQGLIFSQTRFEEIEDLIAAVNAAIDAKTVAVQGGFMTLEEAQKLLDSLETLASYSMDLSYLKGNLSFTEFDKDNGYMFRLVIPADLLEETGLQVAFYDEKTGLLTLLRSERDGNTLVFYADSVEDFIILGDPTVDLSYVLIALFGIMILQLIAIALLLISRNRNAYLLRMNAFALPALLTVRFVPASGLTWLLILIGIVIVLQIALIYLLMTSHLFHRDGPLPFARRSRRELPKKEEEGAEEEAPVQEELAEEEAFPQTDAADTEALADESRTDSFEESYSPDEAAAMLIFEESNEGYYTTEEEEPVAVDETEAYYYEDSEEVFATLEEAPADTEELFYADAEEEPLYEEITEESDAWPYEEEPVQDLTDELPAEEISEWQYDPETGEVFEYAEEQGEYAEDLYELPEEEILPDETEDPEVLAEEAALEKTEELEDEIYVEPDITGDEAPAPDSYYIESDKDDQ